MLAQDIKHILQEFNRFDSGRTLREQVLELAQDLHQSEEVRADLESRELVLQQRMAEWPGFDPEMHTMDNLSRLLTRLEQDRINASNRVVELERMIVSLVRIPICMNCNESWSRNGGGDIVTEALAIMRRNRETAEARFNESLREASSQKEELPHYEEDNWHESWDSATPGADKTVVSWQCDICNTRNESSIAQPRCSFCGAVKLPKPLTEADKRSDEQDLAR